MENTSIDFSFLDELDEAVPEKLIIETDEIDSIDVTTEVEEDYVVKNIKSRDMMKSFDIALGIDPSQNGSGFVVIDNRGSEQIVTMVAAGVQFEEKDTDPLKYIKMQNEFAEDILEVIKETTGTTETVFDFVVIEDVLAKHSPQIFKRLVLLNHVIDLLIATGKVKTKEFYRLNNQMWKSKVYEYKIGKHYKKDKEEIEDILLQLEEPYVVENYHQTERWKENNNYRDKLDAYAMILAVQTMTKDERLNKTTKKKANKLKTWVAMCLDEIPEGAIELKSKRPDNDIEKILDKVKYEKMDNKYYLEFKSLGNWGIKKGFLLPLHIDKAYLVIERK